MIWNIPELQEVNRSMVVVGQVGTATLKILAAVLFAIHVTIQWISFESIIKYLIVNEIIKSTNLKHCLLLSKGLRVVLIPLPHYFISPPHFFIPPPHFFRLATSDSPWVFQSWVVLPSGEEWSYYLSSATTEQPSELSPPGSQLFHWAWHTWNMYYIRI
jgi:hypothetical protein